MNRIASACFALLLKLFPAHFTHRYGREMLDSFERERRNIAGERGGWSALRYTLASCLDVVRAAFRERRRRDATSYRGTYLGGLGLDVRHAVRSLRKSWTFTLVCVFSVAIGLAINTMLVLLTRVTFDPPAAIKTDGVVELVTTTDGLALDDAWSYPDFMDVKRAETGMDVTAYAIGSRNLRSEDGGDGGPVGTMYVSANYVQTLGITLERGRNFAPEDDEVSADPPAIISHSLWRSRYGSDPNIIGRRLTLNRNTFRISGVMPRPYDGHFAGHDTDVWLPLWTAPNLTGSSGGDLRSDRGTEWLGVIGRLRPGTTMTQANVALTSLMNGLAEAHPATNAKRNAEAVRYTVQGGGMTGRLAKSIFWGLSGMVLLVVCLNVAGMVAVRTAARERELALRLAVGSSRARLVRHLMTESVILALVAGVLAIGLFYAALRYIAHRYGAPFPFDIFSTVLLVCIGLSLATTLIIGLLPALKFTRGQLIGAVRDDAGGGGRRSSRVHRIATSVQTALALPLLVINGMILQSTSIMDEADYGFVPKNLMVWRVDLEAEGYRADEVEVFARSVRESVGSVPGVRSVSIADGVPLDYRGRARRVGRAGEDNFDYAAATRVSEDYFETIGTRIVRGRGIEARDRLGTEPVAVISTMLAEQLWPGEDALGKRIAFGWDHSSIEELTVVGITDNVAASGYDNEPVNIFVSMWQHPTKMLTLAMRTSSEDASVKSAIQNAVLALDPNLARPQVNTSHELMETPKREIYAGTIFVGSIAVMTLLLAALGVYGVIAFAVAHRTREIGVRMAMGASRVRVVKMVLRDGLRLALPGIAFGCVLAALAAHYLLSTWYDFLDKGTFDGVSLSVGTGVVTMVVLLASSMPARRAASVQPMRALRSD